MESFMKLDMTAALQPQLDNAPRHVEKLYLAKDIPTNDHWVLLSNHFTSVKDLHLDSGWNERLNDRDIPLHWPLEKITISSACRETCKSPWILEGRVPHLVLNHTSGLRFEGPTDKELVQPKLQALQGNPPRRLPPSRIPRLARHHSPPISASDLVDERKRNKHANGTDNASDKKPDSQLKTLEIAHNDVLDTLHNYNVARPCLLASVQTLSLVASGDNDMNVCDERILESVLPRLTRLTTLVLVLGDNFADRDQLPALFRSLPPNLETLRLQSSVSLARDAVVDEWIDAFENPAFLPRLKSLSIALDLDDSEQDRAGNEAYLAKQHPPEEDVVDEAPFDISGLVASFDPSFCGDNGSSSPSPSSSQHGGGAHGAASPPCPFPEDGSDDGDARSDDQQNQSDWGCGSDVGSDMGPGMGSDMGSGPMMGGPPSNVSDETLALAKRACERLERAAESRGVAIEPFMGEWRKEFTSLTRVDGRWDEV
ncbi:hypothetical protein SLS58_010881 [Diplodia intermedia]|uniref:Uncharacterized protein n=1 Tax=Diplodia intermedia TaxID=856260 RepID=A0ABR3T3J5_9PEZI